MRLFQLAALCLFLLCACAGSRGPLTPVSAGTLAARLANERCETAFGKRPFAPDDFEARWVDDRWHWGTEDGGKVDGYEVEVSFDSEGGGKKVLVRIPEE